MFELDLTDRKILSALDLNSRLPFSAIAKKFGLSKQVAAYRVQKLVESGVLGKFFTILDTSKIGFSTFKVFLRFQNVNRAKEIEIIDFLTSHPKIQWFASAYGNYDLAFNILARNSQELFNDLNEIKSKFNEFIAEYTFTIIVIANFYPRKYLLPKEFLEEKHKSFGSSIEALKIDSLDEKILQAICKNSRTSNEEISKAIGLSPDAVRLRIKNLEKNSVIQGYSIILNNNAIGQEHYKALFSLQNLSEKRERAFDGFIMEHPNIYFSSKGIGLFDFEANIEAKNQAELSKIVFEIREKFSDIVKNYTILQLPKVHKFNFYPFRK